MRMFRNSIRIRNSFIGDFYDFARCIVSGETGYGIGYLYRKGNALIEKAKQKKGVMRVVYNAAGFTLVELSIVLVIVGLLIGGILVAQSMIETSRISATISQLGQFDAAVMNFHTKFNGLPGDSKYHGGDGDGKIEDTFPGHMSSHLGEIANFWAQAFEGEYKGGNYSDGNPPYYYNKISFSGEDKSAPPSKLGKKNSGFHASTYSSTGTANHTGSIGNYYSIINVDNHVPASIYRRPGSGNGNVTLTPLQLLSIDIKIDDAAANSGTVRAGSFNNSWGIPTLFPLANCSDGAEYLIENTGYECSPFIRIGAQTGNLQ